jgi:Rrf2 family protein
MKLSAKSEYALMAILDMAMFGGEDPVQVKSIAKRQSIPVRFLEQVMAALKKGGFVESFRGAQGGYVLARKASDINLAEVLEVVEGPFGQVESATGSNGSHGQQTVRGVIKDIWGEVTISISEILGKVTMQEICDRKRKEDRERTPMYHI